MRVRRETVEHPFATLKMRMGATHFLMKRLPNVATEMALNVLSYNLTRVLNIVASSHCWQPCGREARTDGRPTLHGGARRLTRDAEQQRYSKIAALVSVTIGRERHSECGAAFLHSLGQKAKYSLRAHIVCFTPLKADSRRTSLE